MEPRSFGPSRIYLHVFFDLDRTLWDFERNRRSTLEQMFYERRLASIFATFDSFAECYCRHNERLWRYYSRHEISKEVLRYKRFYAALREFGADNSALASTLDADYMRLLPQHNALVDGARELLGYLSERGYHLHVLTNGLSEVQSLKLERAGVREFFRWVVTPELSGHHKPDARAFGFALARANATKAQSLMVGDSWADDVEGAMRFGIDQIYYNPSGHTPPRRPTHEVAQLTQICGLL